jgi:hypothetical protein
MRNNKEGRLAWIHALYGNLGPMPADPTKRRHFEVWPSKVKNRLRDW